VFQPVASGKTGEPVRVERNSQSIRVHVGTTVLEFAPNAAGFWQLL
jgi:hypothetical protein